MADFYFFTDVDYLGAQPAGQSYGPVSSNPTTEYSTWASFAGIQSGTQLKAYAITDGEFFIQEVTSGIINLVLKPDTQPDNKIGLVKYFVYRGLKKESFLQSNGEVVLNGSNLSQVMSRMWEVRDKINTEAVINEVIKRNDLGLDEIGTSTPIPGTTLIEDIFDTYVFQRLTPGWHIGDFETAGDYGFQVIVEGPNFKPILDDVRVLDHKIAITYQAGQPQFSNQVEEDIKTKLEREKILSFVDPAAYFGLLAFDKIKLYKSDNVVSIKNDPAQFNTEILSKFATKNSIYFDIRNDLNNSLNFYGSYSDASLPTKVAVLKFKDASNPFVNKEYHANGWPILILNTTDFTAGSDNYIKAEFQLPQGDNDLPGLYLSGASFFADGLNYKEKFKTLNLANAYSDTIELSLANLNSPATVLPFVLKLSYTRRYDIDNLPAVPSILTRPWKDDYIDNLLTLNEVNITPPANDLNFSNTVKWNTHSELKYIGWTSLKGFDFTFKNGIARDSIGYVLFGYIDNNSEYKDSSSLFKVTSELNLELNSKKNVSFFLACKELGYLNLYNRKMATNSGSIDIIQVNSTANSLTVDILKKSAENLFSIAIGINEYALLTNNLGNHLSGSSVYCILFNHQLKNDNNDLIYFEADLGIQYSLQSQPNSLVRENKSIKVFSIDGRFYFGADYAAGIKQLITELNV